MCGKHKWSQSERSAVAQEGYEGKTIRLGEEQPGGPAQGASIHWHRFPWWTLWLIWPLFGLIKGAVVAVSGMVGAAATQLAEISVGALSFWPLLLILLGLLLLRRW